MTKQTPKQSKRIYVEDGYNPRHYPEELLPRIAPRSTLTMLTEITQALTATSPTT